MNYWDGQQWTPSEPAFEATPDGNGLIANRVQAKVRLEENLNTPGAITLVHGGTTLQSTPLAIALYDSASGRMAIIAAITNTAPVLISTNKVLYEDAFPGLADVVVTLERGSFEQDVVFTARPDPALFGFPTNTTRIQVITEYFGAPQPDRLQNVIYTETNSLIRARMQSPDLVDAVLGFGDLTIATGRAFPVGGGSPADGGGVPVVKDFITLSGRTFLIESVVYNAVKSALSVLPQYQASSRPTSDKREVLLAGSLMPRVSKSRTAKAGAPRDRLQTAQNTPRTPSGFIIDAQTLLNTYNGLTLQGDTTYFISGPVYCNGQTTIEGGAVIKYPTGSAFIQINGGLTLLTSMYRPAIFTAADDDNVGETMFGVWGGYTGHITPGTGYANPALLFNYTIPQLVNCRFSYCQDTVRIYQSSPNALSVADCQLVRCVRGIIISGCGCGCGCATATLSVNNTLFGRVAYPLTFSSLPTKGYFTQCTFDNIQALAIGASGTTPWTFNNSILSNVTNLTSNGASVAGGVNGIFNSTCLGTCVYEDPSQSSPFAPVGFTDGQGFHIYVANGQGSYYLREQSPFFNVADAGTESASLKADLAQRTAIAPSGVFIADVNSGQTLGPQPIRDGGGQDLGYHYPAVDYVINGATVNSATLNIDQGTVLGFAQYLEWGIRLNPGGRLNVNGYPTNRVVFARLEAVQESPCYLLETQGPLISFKNFFLTWGVPPVQPLAQAKFQYVDFPTLADGMYQGNVQFAPINGGGDFSFSCFQDLTLESCLFQGGWFYHDDAGPQNRTLSIRNTIFERANFGAYAGNYSGWFPDVYSAQLNVANNLFYFGYVWLVPNDLSGSGWIFVDNIFDHVSFTDPDNFIDNGPVGVNHHNAYIGMAGNPFGGDQLIPRDLQAPVLTSLAYSTGPLGRFYLPSSAASLIDHGSRLAASAGLYHFTTLTSNAKELGTQVDIGPHYVALAAAAPIDSNVDGVPDFIADDNGNGAVPEEAGEIPWQTANNGAVVVLAPPSPLSGTVTVTVNAGASASTAKNLALVVDGAALGGIMRGSARFVPKVQLDTTMLQDGTHTIGARVIIPGDPVLRMDGYVIESAPVTVTVANQVRFPAWHDRVEQALSVNVEGTFSLSNYSLFVFDHMYPKTLRPSPVSTWQGVVTGNAINFSQSPGSCNLAGGATDPTAYSFTEILNDNATAGQAFVNPNAQQGLAYPNVGYWCTTYQDDMVDFHPDTGLPLRDYYLGNSRWWHDVMLYNGWYGCGSTATDGEAASLAVFPDSNPDVPQTWPVRDLALPSRNSADKRLLKSLLGYAPVENFYGCGHGDINIFMGIPCSDFSDYIGGKRFRFVFLDGCSPGGHILSHFGAAGFELGRGKTILELRQQIPSGPLSGPCLEQDYHVPDAQNPERLGIRPGAFLVWRYLTVPGGTFNPPVGGYGGDDAPEFAHWHETLLFYWREYARTLVDAIELAGHEAVDPPCWPPWHIDAPVGSKNGVIIYFYPNSCLDIYGFGELAFNGLNHAGDW